MSHGLLVMCTFRFKFYKKVTHYDSFVCDTTHSYVIRLIHRRAPKAGYSPFTGDVTHLHVWHDSFICVTWLIYICVMPHSHVWRDSFICVTGLIHMCDRTLSHVWQDSFICVTRLFHVWTGLFHVICVRMWLRPCSVSQMPIQDPAVPCPWFWTVRYPKGNEMINTHQASSVWKNGRPGAVERPYPHTPVAAHFDRVPEFE